MTSNRINPAVIGKNTNRKRKFSVPDTVTESFEWFARGGSKADSNEVPIFLGILTAVALIMILVPYYIYRWSGYQFTYDELTFTGMDKTFDKLDVIRMSLVLGIGMIVGVLSMAALHFISVLVKMSRRRDQSVHSSAQKTFETLRFLGPYISMTLMAIAAYMMVKHFYPSTIPSISPPVPSSITPPESAPTTTPATPATTDPADASAILDNDKAKKQPDEVETILNLLMVTLDSVLTFGMSTHNLQFKIIFPVIVGTLAIFAAILTFEKFILQMIAVSYRSATTAGRFTENAFALSVVKGLLRTKLEMTGEVKPGRKFDPDLTNALFDAIVAHDIDGEESGASEVLKLKNLENCMDHVQATKLFGILDIAQNGDLTKEEFLSGVKAIYDEQETLTKLVSDHEDIVAKLDDIMLIGVYALDLAFCLNFLGIRGVEMLKTVVSLIVGLGLFFSDALIKLLDSLIFVLITHPYDLGDRVEIDGKYLYVESVGLWTTIFNGPGGLKTIMTNASLAGSKIANFRRSPAENEMFSYLVRPETVTEESVQALRNDCMQFFKDNNRDFLPNWHLETSDQIDNERFKIFIKVFHRHNFQNEEAKNERSQKFALYFKEALLRNGFVFSPSLPRALIAHL